ncbi:uncharacterized protein LOC144950739 [Lampetra fluviatilis]
MEFYERTRVEQLPTGLPFPWLPPDVPVVHVAEGSQERSVVTRVLRHLSDGDARHVLLSGAGRAGGRAVSCSDAVLRRAPGAPLRRAVSAGTRVTAETWEPRARGCGLDTLVVRRSTHTLTVLLTKDELPAGTGDLDLRSIDATIFFPEPKAPAVAGRAVDAAATAAVAGQGRQHGAQQQQQHGHRDVRDDGDHGPSAQAGHPETPGWSETLKGPLPCVRAALLQEHVPSSPLCSWFSGFRPEMPPLLALDRPP